MSDSIARYNELIQDKKATMETPSQRGLRVVCEILHAAASVDLVNELVNKALAISKTAPELSPVVVFQIAADEVKVDELCNKTKI